MLSRNDLPVGHGGADALLAVLRQFLVWRLRRSNYALGVLLFVHRCSVMRLHKINDARLQQCSELRILGRCHHPSKRLLRCRGGGE